MGDRYGIFASSTPLALVFPPVDASEHNISSLDAYGDETPARGYVALNHAPNAAVERRRAALSSAQQAHNEMARLLRARDAVSRSAATAC